MTKAKLYSDLLVCLDLGQALLNPDHRGTNNQPIEVGDVGFMQSGRFITVFNVFKPASDPIHEEFGVPDGFQPLVARSVSTFVKPPGLRASQTVRREDGSSRLGDEPGERVTIYQYITFGHLP